MTRTVAVSEFKAHCLRLVDEVARQGRGIIVTKRGKPIARLVPIGKAAPTQTLARLRGTLIGGDAVGDFDTGMLWEAARR
jgi:prevent-host-death family protein